MINNPDFRSRFREPIESPPHPQNPTYPERISLDSFSPDSRSRAADFPGPSSSMEIETDSIWLATPRGKTTQAETPRQLEF